MTRKVQIALINERKRLIADIAAIDKAISEIAAGGVASLTLSTGDGTQTYTRLNLAALREQRADCARRANAIARRLSGRPALEIGYSMIRRG